MDIVFMGTPDFAVPCLRALVESGENVKAVFTQPDKPKGRGYKLTPPPVKEYAVSQNIPVYQPVSMKKGEDADNAYELLKELAPDLIVVVAYGQILPKRILDIPKTYCINIHASLLPRYRGAGPIQWCILDGEKVTGVTSMIMAEGLDTGDMLIKNSLEIGENETADELHDRLSELGAKVLLDTVKAIKSGDVHPEKQDDSLSNYAPRLTSWPCAVANVAGRKLKIYRSKLDGIHHGGSAGEICDKDKFTVVCGDGFGITFIEVQAEGGKRMKTADYLRGNKL